MASWKIAASDMACRLYCDTQVPARYCGLADPNAKGSETWHRGKSQQLKWHAVSAQTCRTDTPGQPARRPKLFHVSPIMSERCTAATGSTSSHTHTHNYLHFARACVCSVCPVLDPASDFARPHRIEQPTTRRRIKKE